MRFALRRGEGKNGLARSRKTSVAAAGRLLPDRLSAFLFGGE